MVNYTERDIPWTRIIEHKHFEYGNPAEDRRSRANIPPTGRRATSRTIRSTTRRTKQLYAQYKELAEQEGSVVFAGRLGGYKYYDMDKCIAAAFDLVKAELGVELMEV